MYTAVFPEIHYPVDHPPQLYVDLALIRHGRSLENDNRAFIQGSGPDPSNVLHSLGEVQARTGAGTLLSMGIMAVGRYASPLPRARQTCDIQGRIMGCDNLPVHEDGRLREMCKGLKGLPGGMEGRPREEVETPEYWERCELEGWDCRYGTLESQGETPREVGIRSLAAWNDIADELAAQPRPRRPFWRPMGLVYTHGLAIRYGIGNILGWPDIKEINKEYMLDNCHGIVVRRYTEDKRWEIAKRRIELQLT